MKSLLIIYHTQSGNTRQLALAAEAGAREDGEVSVRCLRAFDATLDDLSHCDGVLFATPENFGYMSGALKDFFDRTYYPAQPLELNLPYALLVSAGNDGTNAVRQIDRILLGYPMRKVLEPVIVVGEVTAEGLGRARELGQTLAAGLALGIF